jgi:di/tricarboxylate transporter
MGFESVLTLVVLAACFVALAREWLSADSILMIGLGVVTAAGIIDLQVALDGFANTTLVALGSLFIIAAALRNTGALARAGDLLLGSAKNLYRTLFRLSVSTSVGSAFLNNTPIVAMGIPAVKGWAERNDVTASKLLIPLSYASILGGMCTLIGTSTNLVSDGMLRGEGLEGLGFFELAMAGLPCVIVGWLYLIFIAPGRLPEKEAQVPHVEPDPTQPAGAREQHAVVVREGSRLVGAPIDEKHLSGKFNARLLDMKRGADSVGRAADDNKVRVGDTLMLDTGADFRDTFEDAPEFYVVSEHGGFAPEAAAEQPSSSVWHTRLSVLVLLAVILLAAFELLHIGLAALLGAGALLICGVITPGEAREAIDWEVLIVIGAALGLGQAMEASGAATMIGAAVVGATSTLGPLGLLAGVILTTMLLTETITNNGAVALMFPVALSVAASEGLDARPLIIGMTLAGSMSMSTPLGYQTNLMVYSAGQYDFLDFVRVGLPLQLLLMVVIIVVIPFFWPF